MRNQMNPLLIAIGITISVGLLAFLVKIVSSEQSFIPSKRIGYVEISGTITSSRKTTAWIDTLIRDRNVPVILVRVSSPGGGVVPSYEIYKKLVEARDSDKIVVVSMGSIAASGAYMISCAGDVVVANPGTITGSIGVILQSPDFSKLMDRVGVKMNTIKSAKYKDIASPYRPMAPDEKELLKNVILDVYDQFVDIVAQSRRLPADSVRKIADGRIFTGRQAYEIGLVDTLGTFDDAVKIAAQLAWISGTPKFRKQRPRRLSLFDLLSNRVSELLAPFQMSYMIDIPSEALSDQ